MVKSSKVVNRTFNKTIIKMIKSRYVRFILTVLIILISSSITSGLGNLLPSYTPGYLEIYKEDNIADLILKVNPSEEDIKANKYISFDNKDVERIKNVENVKDVTLISSYDYLTDKEEDNLRVTVYEDISKREIATPILMSGELPKNFEIDTTNYIIKYDVLIQQNIDGTANKQIGDKVNYSISTTYMGMDLNVKFELTVTGIAKNTLYTTTNKERGMSKDVVYVTNVYYSSRSIMNSPFASMIFPNTDMYVTMQNHSEFLTKEYDAEASNLRDIISEIEVTEGGVTFKKYKDKATILTLEENGSYALFKSYSNKIFIISLILPGFFILVCALLVLIISSRLVVDERGMIACYASLGVKKSSIYRKYLTFSVAASIIGSILGYFLGIYLIPYVIFGTYSSVCYMTSLSFSMFSLIGIVVNIIILLTAIGVTMYTVHKSLRESPAQLLRPKAPKEGKKILFEKITFLWKILPFSYKSSIRNIFRQKKNLILTSLSVIGSVVLVFLGLSLTDISNSLTQDPLFHGVAKSMGVVSTVIVIYGVAMASIIIYSLASMNIDDREREIAVLKVLGYSDIKCALYTSRELILITVFAGLIGIPASVGATAFLFGFLKFGGIENVKVGTYLLSYFLIVASSLISSLFLYPKIKKIDFNISLKAME